MGNGFLKWNYSLLGVTLQMFIFQMQDSITPRKVGQSLFNKTLPCGFHGSTCVEKCTPSCVFTFNIKFFQIIITNNMWIKGQTGNGMATF
jgi:hypothetical protein